jgi:hypothetical protein
MAQVKLIAHRGLYKGPDKSIENQPKQILDAINLGFDAEIDLWIIDKKFYLGHDTPQYKITAGFLDLPELWIHAKNLDALYWLSKTNLKYFWHQSDDRVITSNGYIWTYPEKELTDRSVRLMPEWADPEFRTIKDQKCFAICSDYVSLIKEILGPAAEI